MAALAFLADSANKKVRAVLIFTLFLFIALFSGMRGTVGQDTFSYINIYDSYSIDSISIWIFRLEPFFILLLDIHKRLFDSSGGFVFFISAVQSFLLWYATKNLKYRFAFILIYLFTYYLNFHFNVLRAGLALLLFLGAISIPKGRASLFLFIVAFLSHFSILIFTPLYFLLQGYKVKFINLFLLAVLSSIFLYLFGSYIIEKAYGYDVISDLSSVGFSTIPFMMFVLGGFFFIYYGRVRKDFFYAFSFFSIVYFFMGSIDILYRVSHMAFLVLLFVFFRGATSGKSLSSSPALIYMFVLSTWIAIGTWKLYVNELDHLAADPEGRGNPEYTYIPYEIRNFR